MTVNRPVKFPGTPEERRANRNTHGFMWDHEDARCWRCDVRPSHVSADYPCGADVPREVVTWVTQDDGTRVQVVTPVAWDPEAKRYVEKELV